MIEFLTAASEVAEKAAPVSSEVPKIFQQLGETEKVSPQETKETNSTETNVGDIADETGEKNIPQRFLICRNEGLAGDVHPITGVPFEQKQVTLPNGEVVVGVFPEFDKVFEAKLDEDMYEASDRQQFKECNAQLYKQIENDPKLKALFTDEQVEQIKDGIADGTAPDGYVWHHTEKPGVMQLVDSEIHTKTGHTGGRTVWGGGNENR